MKISIITETTEDMDLGEPRGWFDYDGKQYPYWGSVAGRLKTLDYDVAKFNRYAKIGDKINDIIDDLNGIIKSNWKSIDARCAFATLLMIEHGIRVGNEDSAMGYESGLEDNIGEIVQTYGVTTLLNKHVKFIDDYLKLHFLGKTQVEQNIKVFDVDIIKYAKLYYDEYLPDEKWIGIDYDMLFKFVKDRIGDYVPKDFRTFCANVTGWESIEKFLDKPKLETKTEANGEIKQVVDVVSNKLGNTPNIAKAKYIDRRMLDWFKNKRLISDY